MNKLILLGATLLALLTVSCNSKQQNNQPDAPVTDSVKTEISKITVPCINIDSDNINLVADTLQKLPNHSLAVVNWPEAYPSKPEVVFRIAHNSDNILLQYDVKENEIMGVITEDNGKVWTDSAVEFFLSFDGEHYYNAEFNCIGTALISYRTANKMLEMGSPQIVKSIKRLSSLGSGKRDKTQGDFHWTLTLVIPRTAYWKNDIATFNGLKAKGNFYKCGDNLTTPHFVSWAKIGTPEPSFHEPSFFGEIEFEK